MLEFNSDTVLYAVIVVCILIVLYFMFAPMSYSMHKHMNMSMTRPMNPSMSQYMYPSMECMTHSGMTGTGNTGASHATSHTVPSYAGEGKHPNIDKAITYVKAAMKYDQQHSPTYMDTKRYTMLNTILFELGQLAEM